MTRPLLHQLEELARRMGRGIDEHLNPDGPKEVAWFVWLGHMGDGGFGTYVSNAERDDMISMLEELLEKLKASPPPRRGGK